MHQFIKWIIYDHSFFGDSVRSFFSSRPQYAILGTGILGQIASFERRLRGAAPTPLALPYPFRTSTWRRIDAERDNREESAFLFLFWAVYARAILGSWHIYMKKKSRGSMSKLASFPHWLESKFPPDVAFFMAAPKRLPYRSYYHCCCVSLPFGSVGTVLCNQQRMCSEYDHRDHIWYSGARALETLWVVMIAVSFLVITTNCSTWRGDSSGDPPYEVGDNCLTNSKTYLVVFLA